MRMWAVVKYNAFELPVACAIAKESDPMDCCSQEATNTKGEDQVECDYYQEMAGHRSVTEHSIHGHRQCVMRISVKFVICLARQLVYRTSNVMCIIRNLYSMIGSRRHKSCCNPHHAKSTVLDRREHRCSLRSLVFTIIP
jgi:hypothetical protein